MPLKEFDPQRLWAHRRAQAALRWPLLRGCPNTSAVNCLRFLDDLPPERVGVLMDEWQAFEAMPTERFETQDAMNAYLAEYPLFEAYLAHLTGGVRGDGVATLPVKVIAGLIRDGSYASLEDWAHQTGRLSSAAKPWPPLAETIADLLPIPPRQLRSKLATMAQTRFGARPERLDAERTRFIGTAGAWSFALDVAFAKGNGRDTHQLDYAIWLRSALGQGTLVGGYEGLWRLPTAWNYLTEENADRSLQVLGDIVETMAGLMP